MQKEAPSHVSLQLILLLLRVGFIVGQGDWYQGRATFYGTNPGAGDTIMNGNCGYGYINKDEPVGWNVGALSDSTEAFRGACGRCYEIKCDPIVIYDAYGQSLDRTEACFDPSASIVIRITDACPCNYPNNPQSNRRWCCGDTMHIDLSVYAYEKLADRQWGAIGIQYREVPCYYTPSKQAYLPGSQNPFPDDYTNRPDQLPNRGYDWTSLKGTWVQVEAKGSQHQVINAGSLQSAWTVIGSRVNASGAPPPEGSSKDQGPSKRAPAACFRLQPTNGTVIFQSEVNHTFANITGVTVSVRKGQFGVVPEIEMLLGRFNGSFTPLTEDSKGDSTNTPQSKPGKVQFEACPRELPLRTLVPVPQKKAPRASWATPRHSSVTALLQEYHGSAHDPQSPDLLPELPAAPEGDGSVTAESDTPGDLLTLATELKAKGGPTPAPSPDLNLLPAETATYVVSLGGRLDDVCRTSDVARNRIFLGCGKLSADDVDAIMFRNKLPVVQDICIYELELTPAEAPRAA
eukprot:jgi/Botrbrau1/12551/Bobra.0169s0088.1